MSSFHASTLHADGALGAPSEDAARARPNTSPLSPELVLVAPELAGAARRGLPDRPWEAVQGAASGTSRGELSRPPHGDRVQPRIRRSTASSRWMHVWHAVEAAAIAAVLVAVTAPLMGDLTGDGKDPETTAVPVVKPPKKTTTSSSGPPPLLVATAGYVVSPAGSFSTGPSGRTIEHFTLPVRCGSQPLVIRNVAVTARTIRITARPAGRSVTVRVRARVVDPRRVRGVLFVAGGACGSSRVAFEARLS